METEVQPANLEAVRRIGAANPVLVGLEPATELVPSLAENDLLHAGPPLEGWQEACGALRGSVIGTLVHCGVAKDLREAQAMAEAGDVRLRSANENRVLGTFAGVIARNTPIFIVEDRATGIRAGAAINEGRGKALRYGSTAPETLERLGYLETEFHAVLDRAIQLRGGVDIAHILEQALHMGDDGHSRQKAASSLFLNTIVAPLTEAGFSLPETTRALRFLAANDFFFLPITIAGAKAALLAAEGIPESTIVTCMATNGSRFGIQISAAAGRWFTGPVPALHGRYFNPYTEADAGPMIGDSVIAETSGLGAFAMAGAPALASYVGGTYDEAKRMALEMYKITVAEHPRYKTPSLGYRGTPLGIDAELVVKTGIGPIFNSGISHREPGVGQIGAGFGRAPLSCFQEAMASVRNTDFQTA
jgi:hypothetical protein